MWIHYKKIPVLTRELPCVKKKMYCPYRKNKKYYLIFLGEYCKKQLFSNYHFCSGCTKLSFMYTCYKKEVELNWYSKYCRSRISMDINWYIINLDLWICIDSHKWGILLSFWIYQTSHWRKKDVNEVHFL